jgi:hypothetical protein
MYGECPACGRARVIAPRAESVTSCAAEQSDGMALPCLAAETTSYSADSRRRRTRAGASVTNSNDHSPLSLRPEPIRDTACSNQRNRTRKYLEVVALRPELPISTLSHSGRGERHRWSIDHVLRRQGDLRQERLHYRASSTKPG